MDTIELIKNLSNARGASGYEDEVIELVKNHAAPLHFSSDAMMNAYLTLPEKSNVEKPTLMLDAHSDEVAFMVQAIDANGLLTILPLGGWVVENAAAQLFWVKTKYGYIKAVVASKPPHFMTAAERERKLTMADLKLDVGATSREEVINDFGIEVGAPAVPFVNFEYNEKNGTMLGKAFDNRLGCAAVIKTLERLAEQELAVYPVGALAAQEEVGTRGAEVTARTVKPSLAIVFEGSPSDDFFTDEYTRQGALGKGVQIRVKDNGYISHHGFLDFAVNIAKTENIPYQLAVRSGGSTDAAAIHLANGAVPVLVLGIPVRYAHTHHCFAKLSDFNDAVDLAVTVVQNIQQSGLVR